MNLGENINVKEVKLTLKKYDGEAPKYESWAQVPLGERVKSVFTREVLVKDPVEVIERRYDENWEEIPR